MALKSGKAPTNGSGVRSCTSWIDSFLDYTKDIESCELFRKWSAISAIGAVLEQKVWIKTTAGAVTYPHLYVFLIGKAGKGKSWPISTVTKLIRELPEPHIAPTSMSMAAMVDELEQAKRTIIVHPDPAIEYHSMFIAVDEMSAFMHKYEHELVAGLTKFYDVDPYGRSRVYKGKQIKIARPQLNILTGATPSGLLEFMPDGAWEMGFSSRIILVYADEKPIKDLWNAPANETPEPLVHDLLIINNLMGQFGWTQEWSTAMQAWKVMTERVKNGEVIPECIPIPSHPKLQAYVERRERHMMKLSMIASVDRGNDLMLTKEDFNKAMGWLLEVERVMPMIFQSGAGGIDSKAMDEIMFFVKNAGERGVNQQRIVNFARTHVLYAHNVMNVLDLMETSGMIKVTGMDAKFGLKVYKAAS